MKNAVIIGHRKQWQKWPDTRDFDYTEVYDHRFEIQLDRDIIKARFYPVYLAFSRAGVYEFPVDYPFINNLKSPPDAVIDRMMYDLQEIARDGAEICIWEHVWNCYPEVAKKLKSIFKKSILIHCDDSEGPTGSTEVRTRPIAKYFDAALHGNVIWKFDGEPTAKLYHDLGVNDTHYIALSTTGGFKDRLKSMSPSHEDSGTGIAPIRYKIGWSDCSYSGSSKPNFSFEDRVSAQLSCQYSNDLVFVGGLICNRRGALNTPETTEAFSVAGLRTKVYGIGMRDGPLLPRVAETLGVQVAELYLDSFAVLNVQFVGLMGTRPYDAWASGTLLVQHDPVGELDHLGIKAGVHYASYDGTIEDLIRVVRYYQEHLSETENILRAGKALGERLEREYSIQSALEKILAGH